MHNKLLEILACPLCKGPLHLDEQYNELICKNDKLAFPIEHDIPIMLYENARQVKSEELDNG